MSSFGIPKSERTFKALIGPLVKTGEKGTARSGSDKPVALEYFKVVNASGELIPEFNDRPEKLRIELVSDNIADFWRDRLNCYDGRTCFCFNDSGGTTALRRSANGIFQPVECNPAKCALRMNETRKPNAEDSKEKRLTEYQQDIIGRWRETYKYAHLNENSRCKSQTYFLFALPHPRNPGEYITRPGEYARYASGSHNINNQLLKGLKDICDSVGGYMRGLQVDLVMSFTTNSFGGRVPTVGLVGPSINERAQAIAEMSKRRAMASLDMEAAMRDLAQLSQEELANVDADYLYTHFYLGENVALPEHAKTMALPAPKERVEVDFASNNPLISALINKCRLSYADVTKLQMKYGDDIAGFQDELETFAANNKIDISSVLARFSSSSYASEIVRTDLISAPAPSEPEYEEVEDDEVNEPETEAEKDDLFADLKKKFDNRQDS